jgi:hypothetical protein
MPLIAHRYFAIALAGMLYGCRPNQKLYHKDIILFQDPTSGFTIHFYWRPTLSEVKRFLASADVGHIEVANSIVIINNNVHEAIENAVSFYDTANRYKDINQVTESAKRVWGYRRVFWRTPNDLRGTGANQTISISESSPPSRVTTMGDAAKLDGEIMAPRSYKEATIPLIDAFKMTSEAEDGEYFDGMHLRNWELYQEVNVWLNQLQMLYQSGWWEATRRSLG